MSYRNSTSRKGRGGISTCRRLLLCERVRARDRDHAFRLQLISSSFFFSRSFRPLVITDQLRHEVRLRAGIPRVLVAKVLGDAATVVPIPVRRLRDEARFPFSHTLVGSSAAA